MYMNGMNAISPNAIVVLLCLSALLVILPATATGDSCSLTAHSIPDGAAISIDGMLIGTAPQEALTVSCGNHTVTMSANGYSDFTENVTLVSGNPQEIVANLQRIADTGSVFIQSNPSGGDVYVDGILQGKTPLLVDALSPGAHSVLIRKTGYNDYRDVVTAGPGMIPEYNEFLVPLPQTGFLGIISSPDNATAYIDGALFGTTPTLLTRVAAGNHTLLVQKDGYWNYTQTIEVQGGTSALAQVTLQQIPNVGNLIIGSTPSGTALYLNGVYKTVTPVTFENIPQGNYSVAFQKPNYTAQNISFTLFGGDTVEIYAALSTDPSSTSQPGLQRYTSDGNDTVANLTGPGAGPVIDKTYNWYSLGRAQTITVHVPENLYDYYKNQTHPTDPSQLKNYTLSAEDRLYLADLVGQLKDASGNQNFAARNDYRTVTAFVQGIPYALHTDPATGQTTTAANDYWKYPVETLAEGNGDCIDDAILAAALLKEMNYDVAIVVLPQVSGEPAGHAVVGIACDNCNGYYYPVDGKKYYYLDLTASGNELGKMNYQGTGDSYANTPAEVVVL